MTRGKPDLREENAKYPSYRTRLFIVITLIIFLFILLISCITYVYTVDQVMYEFNNTRMQTEKNFVSSAILVEYGVESFDSQYDFLLHERLQRFLKAYREAGGNPARIDLEGLKRVMSEGVSGTIELYVINKSGVIEYTTYPKDYLVDFSKYPTFFSSLTKIRQGDVFRSDPWIRSYTDSQLYWKYGYLPTEDHEYLLEIGLLNANYSQLHKEMVINLRKIASEGLTSPSLLHVEVYDKAHRKQAIWSEETTQNISSLTGLFAGKELNSLLNQTFERKQAMLIENPQKHQIISIQYLNLSTTRSASGAEMSYVGFLVFSTEDIAKTIDWYRTGILIITFIALLMAVIIAEYLSVYISRPIEMMSDDVNIITSSSLSHSVRATGVRETEQLRKNINQMVANIKDYITEIEYSQGELKTELGLRRKAEESLERVNKRLTQLTQITRHDILNQITALYVYLDEIPETSDKAEVDEYARKAHAVLDTITHLLRYTYEVENIGLKGPIWQSPAKILDQCQEEFLDRITIIHHVDTIEILATPLFSKVFYNLIDNTIRHGKKAKFIQVGFEDRVHSGCLVYEDDGAGVPPVDKERIFERGYGAGTGFGMAFIKEILESDEMKIVERGVQGNGVRFEITIPCTHYRIIDCQDK